MKKINRSAEGCELDYGLAETIVRLTDILINNGKNTDIYIFATASITAIADSPRAFLITNSGKYILRIGHGQSFYFDPQTNSIESLENDPQGKIMLQKAEYAALKKAMADMEAGL